MSNRATVIRQKRLLLYLATSHRALASAIEDALLHRWIAHRTAATGLPVAWDYVCDEMGRVLESVTDTEQEDSRAGA
jgi:hypothetical protein